MTSRLPNRTYGIVLIPVVLNVLVWITEQYISGTHWWAKWMQSLPMETIWLCAGAFIIGLLVQDTFYPNSWIRANWKHITRKFEIVWLSVNYADHPKRLEVSVRIKFVRPIKSAKLALRIFSCTGMKSSPHVHPIHVEHLSNVMKDEQRTIRIATRVISYPGWIPFHSIWGEDQLSVDANSPVLVGGSKNVVYLELIGTLIPQCHRFFVSNISFGGAPNDVPAIYAQDEDEDVFRIS